MARSYFVNSTEVRIGGKLPRQKFQLEVADDGSPVDPFWRKRLGDGAIAPARSDAAPSPASPPVESEAPKKFQPKKGA